MIADRNKKLEFEDNNGNGESNWICRRTPQRVRELKYSAKRKDSGEMVTGYHFARPNDPAGPKDFIVTVGSAKWIEIDPATLKLAPAKHAVSQEQFKNMILDIIMRAKADIPVGIRNMFLDVLDNYIVSPVWEDMQPESSKKLEDGKYYFIAINEEFRSMNPHWGKPVIAKRIEGGFNINGFVIYDDSVGKYAEITYPEMDPYNE